MKTFGEFLKLKESVRNKFNNFYGDDYDGFTQPQLSYDKNRPIPGRTYEYYLNLFNSQTGGNLGPEHLEALEKHKQNDALYRQRISAHHMTRNTQEGVENRK